MSSGATNAIQTGLFEKIREINSNPDGSIDFPHHLELDRTFTQSFIPLSVRPQLVASMNGERRGSLLMSQTQTVYREINGSLAVLSQLQLNEYVLYGNRGKGWCNISYLLPGVYSKLPLSDLRYALKCASYECVPSKIQLQNPSKCFSIRISLEGIFTIFQTLVEDSHFEPTTMNRIEQGVAIRTMEPKIKEKWLPGSTTRRKRSDENSY